MRPVRLAGITALIAPTLLVAAAACSNDPSAGPSATLLEVVQAPSAVGLPGYMLYDTVIVRAVDEDGEPRAGVKLQWVVDVGAVVAPLSLVTDSDGRAAARWTLASQEGEQYLEVRTLEDSSVTFAVTAQVFQTDLLFGQFGVGCGLRSGDIWCFNRSNAEDPVSVGLGWDGALVIAPPIRVTTGMQFVQMSTRGFEACGLDSIGGIACYPGGGQPMLVPALPPMSAITNGGNFGHVCGLTVSDSTPRCFATAALQIDTTRLVEFGVNDGLACGRRPNGSARCWQLIGGILSAGADVPGGHQFTRVDVGEGFACGIDGLNILWCWGDGRYGQLGGGTVSSQTPVQVLDNVSAVSVSEANGLALRNGIAMHWGFWNGGAGPAVVPSLQGKTVTALSRGSNQCVLLAGGRTWCAEELWANDVGSTFYPVQPVEGS